jgi:putative transposase
MKKETTSQEPKSSIAYEELENFVRSEAQKMIQRILEEEVTELLGRQKYERKHPLDARPGSRNGYGKPRKLTMSCGTITVRRPRVRNLEERFESRILPLFERRTKQVAELIPELYLHGLAEGDFDLALRGLLGDDAPISASTVARLKKKWQPEFEEWSSRPLDDLEVVYLWIDGIYVKAGLEKEKAAVLVAVAGLSDGSKSVVALESGHRESTESWSSFLRGLRGRGMNCPRVVIGDGHLGIWAGLRNVYPEADEQRCWKHRMCNVLDKLPRKLQPEATGLLQKIMYAETEQEASQRKAAFQRWCREHGQERAGCVLDRGWEQMVTFYKYPKAHWKHLRTSNPAESPFASVRLRTNAAKRFKKVENATAVIWKMLMITEKKFRRLSAPELMKDVFEGRQYENGIKKYIDTKSNIA